jgi:hypothetical protein
MKWSLSVALTNGLARLLGLKRKAAPHAEVSDYLDTLGYPVVGTPANESSDAPVIGAQDRRRTGG